MRLVDPYLETYQRRLEAGWAPGAELGCEADATWTFSIPSKFKTGAPKPRTYTLLEIHYVQTIVEEQMYAPV
jgi:hypothetical protein